MVEKVDKITVHTVGLTELYRIIHSNLIFKFKFTSVILIIYKNEKSRKNQGN